MLSCVPVMYALQVMKIAITPCVVAMEFVVFGKTLDRYAMRCTDAI